MWLPVPPPSLSRYRLLTHSSFSVMPIAYRVIHRHNIQTKTSRLLRLDTVNFLQTEHPNVRNGTSQAKSHIFTLYPATLKHKFNYKPKHAKQMFAPFNTAQSQETQNCLYSYITFRTISSSKLKSCLQVI
jgi:hypothetical protein